MVYLNVGGLKSKSENPELQDLIQSNDVIVFGETNLDDTDRLWSENYFSKLGFEVFLNNRTELATTKKSGGIAIAVKNELRTGVSCIPKSCNLVQWVKCDKAAFGLYRDLVLGGVYLPPETSRYGGLDIFDELSQELLKITSKGDQHVCLLGDFNAHTKDLSEIVDIDRDLFERLHLDEVLESEPVNVAEIGLRSNKDKSVNNYGYRFIEFLKAHGLFIINGRVGSDKGVGEFTCFKGRSRHVVDYFVVSHDLFTEFTDCEVQSFDRVVSDVHCPVVCKIRTGEIPGDIPVPPSPEGNADGQARTSSKIKWDKGKSDRFTDALLSKDLESVNNALRNGVSVSEVNNMICDILVGTAEEVMGRYEDRRFKQRPQNNGRGNQCNIKVDGMLKVLRGVYRRAKRRFRSHRSEANRVALNRAFRQYKYEIKKRKLEKKAKHNAELRRSRSGDPRHYWRFFKKSKSEKCGAELDDLFNFFRDINNAPNDEGDTELTDPNGYFDVRNDDMLNRPFTSDEISKSIKDLKNNKSCGIDEISNEFLKTGCDVILPTLVLLFNRVLETGEIPELWLNGVVIPIFKKGDVKDPGNYRGITLLSCVGKLFTSLINSRLTEYLNVNELLLDNQAGFRKGHSITDHIFTLKTLVDMFLDDKRKLYCIFIDYQKAFDTIWRKALWHKLIAAGIQGKVFKVIHNMYENIKSCIFANGSKSALFDSCTGLRQGENLSPILFSLYVNDLEGYLTDRGVPTINFYLNAQEAEPWFRLLILLYADDTVLLADSPAELQRCIDELVLYCKQWKLVINRGKTKAIVFERRRSANLPEFYIEGEPVESVTYFIYLGVIFNYTGSFQKCRKALSEQARKALFFVLNKVQEQSLDLDIALHLFDVMVASILTFGSEIWGFESLDLVEKLHLLFCKYILKLKRSTPNIMVYGELGRFPMEIVIKVKMVKFWGKLVMNNNSLSGKMYHILYLRHLNGKSTKWITFIKGVLENCGMGEIWLNQTFPSVKCLGEMVKRRLQDQFIQQWHGKLIESPKASFYRIIKCEWGAEEYLSALDTHHRIILCKFRTSNHRLPVETGRYVRRNREDRICEKCHQGIGDESHYLFSCPFFNDLRRKFIPTFYNSPRKVKELFHASKKTLASLAIFVNKFTALL